MITLKDSDPIHHIIELEEDWEQRLNPLNLIPLSHRTETLGGIKTDYKYIIKYLEDLIKQNDLKPQLVCYDPHNASAFLSDLEALGFDSVAITQTAKELNDATVDFRLEIIQF